MTALLLHLAFALGGGLGAMARHGLTVAITHRYPVSTLVVNVAGCFLLGLGFTVLAQSPGLLGEEERRLLAGFCGGFTTFSTFAWQSLDLHRTHSLVHAAINILLSLVLCVLAFLAGRVVGAQLG